MEQLKQHYVVCPSNVKDGYLVQIVRKFKEEHPRGSIMIFTNTCKYVDKFFKLRTYQYLKKKILRNCQLLSMTLQEVGFTNVCLHAMISQKLRLVALNKFKSLNVKILVATDVASRGTFQFSSQVVQILIFSVRVGHSTS